MSASGVSASGMPTSVPIGYRVLTGMLSRTCRGAPSPGSQQPVGDLPRSWWPFSSHVIPPFLPCLRALACFGRP